MGNTISQLFIRLIEPRPYDAALLPHRTDSRIIQVAFEYAPFAVHLDARGPADIESLYQALRGDIDILHFDGHAERRHDGTHLVLERRRDGLTETVPLIRILEYLDDCRSRQPPILLCLSCCDPVGMEERRRATDCAGLSALIAFDGKIKRSHASMFFDTFYRDFADRCDAEHAYQVAASRFQEMHDSRSVPEPIFVQSAATGTSFLARRSTNRGPGLSLEIDRVGRLVGPDLHDAARTLRTLSAKLHLLLVDTGRTRRFITIIGPHDTGRTSLAKSVARHIAFQFNFVVHFVLDFRKTSVSAEELADALLQLAAPYIGTGADSADPVAQLESMLCTADAKGVLLLLEVWEPAQLTTEAWALLSGVQSPSAVVVVGSMALSGLGAQTFHIEPLPKDEALLFFADRLSSAAFETIQEIKAELESSFNRIYEKLGGHPLALSAAASNIKTVSDIRRLANAGIVPPTRGEPWLERSIAVIKEDSQTSRILSVLSLFHGPLPQDIALAAVGEYAPRRLDELADRGLLQRGEIDSTPQRSIYFVHTTLRRFVLTLLPVPLMEALRIFTAVEFGKERFDWSQSVLTWLENLQKRDLHAFYNKSNIDELAKLAKHTYQREISYHLQRWHHSIVAELQKKVADFFMLLGQVEEYSHYRLLAARMSLRSGELQRARELIRPLLDRHHDSLLRGRSMGVMADILRRDGKMSQARSTYRQALIDIPPSRDPLGVAEMLRGLAEVEREAGNFGHTLEYLEHAFFVLQNSGLANAGPIAQTLERKAYLFQVLRYEKAAIQTYDEAQELLLSDDPEHVRIAIGLGDVCTDGGNFEQAAVHFNVALRRSEQLDNALLSAEVWSRLARCYARAKDRQGVANAIDGALKLVESKRIPKGYRVLRLQIELAEAAARGGDPGRAHELLNSAQEDGFLKVAGSAGQAMVLRARALLKACEAQTESDFVEGARMFHQAYTSYVDIEYHWRAARCGIHLVAMLMAAGDHAAASEQRRYHRDAQSHSESIRYVFYQMEDWYRLRLATLQAASLADRLHEEDGQSLRRYATSVEMEFNRQSILAFNDNPIFRDTSLQTLKM